jgi:hypothetical protein
VGLGALRSPQKSGVRDTVGDTVLVLARGVGWLVLSPTAEVAFAFEKLPELDEGHAPAPAPGNSSMIRSRGFTRIRK